ncbi:Transcription factor DIVARICATA [Linum perenne]
MRWEMEVLSPASYLSSTDMLIEDGKITKWTRAENKLFENALALYDKDTPDRWQKVAALIPGKTVGDVINQYKELEADVSSIEAGLIPIPGYCASPFTLEWVSSHGFDGFKQTYGLTGKRSSSGGRTPDQERKKGVPWTEEEHKLFLMGLKKYGKGDWRNISRNFVVTRTPTQVASHAQKYFIRQLSGGKDKRRASIHDITTVNLNDTRTNSPDSKQGSSPDQSSVLSHQHQQPMMSSTFQWNTHHGRGGAAAAMAFGSSHGNMFMSPPYGGFNSSYGSVKAEGGDVNDPYVGPQSMAFQMQSAQSYPHG